MTDELVKQKPWSKREEDIIRELWPNPNVTIADLSKVLNRRFGSVRYKIRALGVKKRFKRDIDEEYLKHLRRMIEIE